MIQTRGDEKDMEQSDDDENEIEDSVSEVTSDEQYVGIEFKVICLFIVQFFISFSRYLFLAREMLL